MTTGSISGQECEIRDLYLGDHNEDTKNQLDVEVHNKNFAGNYRNFNLKTFNPFDKLLSDQSILTVLLFKDRRYNF